MKKTLLIVLGCLLLVGFGFYIYNKNVSKQEDIDEKYIYWEAPGIGVPLYNNPNFRPKDYQYIAVANVDSSVNVVKYDTFDTTRSSFIRGAFYDKNEEFLILNLSGTYYRWCHVPEYIWEEFKETENLGGYYKKYIEGEYDCSHVKAKEDEKRKREEDEFFDVQSEKKLETDEVEDINYVQWLQETERIKFNQQQQKLCEEKYASEFNGTGYNWYGGPGNYTKKDVKITYSENKKACIEEYIFERGEKEGDGTSKFSSQIEIKNLDNGVIYFTCTEDGNMADCLIGCSKKKMKTCVGDIDEDEENPFTKIINSDYIKILRKLGLISEEEIEQMKSFDELIDEES